MTPRRRAVRVLHITDRGVSVDYGDGRVSHLDLNSPRSCAEFEALGLDVEMMKHPPRRLSRTPAQDHIADPIIVDPRVIRPLSIEQQRVWRHFVSCGAFVAVAGFETWRGRDRYLYLDVLGVFPTIDDASAAGLPLGPLNAESSWVPDLRMVGDQLALRMADPWGHGVREGRDRQDDGRERDPGFAKVW